MAGETLQAVGGNALSRKGAVVMKLVRDEGVFVVQNEYREGDISEKSAIVKFSVDVHLLIAQTRVISEKAADLIVKGKWIEASDVLLSLEGGGNEAAVQEIVINIILNELSTCPKNIDLIKRKSWWKQVAPSVMEFSIALHLYDLTEGLIRSIFRDYPSSVRATLHLANYIPEQNGQSISELYDPYDRLNKIEIVESERVFPLDGPIKVAYLVGNASKSSNLYFVQKSICLHARKKITPILLYYFSGEITGCRRELVNSIESHDISSMSMAALTKLYEDLKVDIIIDLIGHFQDSRIPSFVRKPFPVVINFLYACSTRSKATDFFLCDETLIPEQQRAFYSEKILPLDRSYVCFQWEQDFPEVNKKSTRGRPIIFGNLSQSKKFSPPTIRMWADVLRRVPSSVLVLKDCPWTIKSHFLQCFASLGVHADRIKFLGRVPNFRTAVGQYSSIDILLDTYPFAGETSLCEALYMGVPAVVRIGELLPSRLGASILEAAGLPEFIARGHDDYVDKAVALASDTARLEDFHRTLRSRLEQSQLMDALGFTRSLERALLDAHAQTVAQSA